jgi:soluble lytic murein transglycosylase-like protein
MHKITFLAVAAIASTGVVNAAGFSASDVKGVGIRQPGKIVIRNDAKSITAFRFFDNVKEALVSLASMRIQIAPFSSSKVYDARGPITRPMPAYLSAIMTEAGARHGVDPRLIAAVAQRESRFNPNAISPVGACGVMQLMPATARYLGVSNVFDARENVMGGTRYLRTLLDTFHGDLDLTLAAYNAGPGAVQKYRGVPPYAETKAYVANIRSSYERSLRD